MLVTQLQADDCVRVWAPNVSSGNHPSQTCSNTSGPDNEKADGSIRPGKVTHSYGNAHYDIAFVDGQLPADEKYVIRNRLTPVAEGTMYDGIITSVYLPATVSETSHLAFKYDMRLQNGEIVRKLGRSDLRVRQECFPPDMAFIGAIFCPSLQTLNRSGGQLSESAKYVDIKLQQLRWGSKQVVKVYVMLPAPLKAIQVRSATTNKLLEAELMERNEDQPRFLGQYHGFVKGKTLEKDEKEKLEVVYTASCKRQAYNAHSAGMMPFEKNNCFYLIIAPPLLVRVHGRAIIKASSPSELLFRALASIILGNNPGRAVAIFQRLLRAKCNSSPQPEKKVRTVVIESVSVEFGSSPQLNVVLDFMSEKLQAASRPAQPDLNGVSLSGAIIDIKFLISVPYADKGSLNDAVGNAYDEATTIAKQLKSVKKLSMDSTPALQGSDSAGSLDVEAMSWSFEDSTTMTKPERFMLVEFTDGSESFDTEPIVSLECEPLEDIRVRAHDSSGNVHDLHFPIHNVVAEAKVRRELSPFIKATVLPKPLSTDTSSPHYRLQFQKGTLKHKKHDAVLNVPPEDIKYDVLSVRVLEASKMTLKGNMGAGDIYVKVLLVSSDFNPGERTTVTPFGLKVSSTGEILQDTSNQENSGKQEKTDHDKQYSQNYWKTNCFTLRRNKADMTWGSKDECPSVEFKYPDIDIDRVSEVRLVLWDKKTASSKIGVVTISLKEINEFCRVPASDSKLVATRKFSIHRDELGRKVVGKISLKIARIQDYDVGAEVYARQLEENVDFWTICPKELLRKALNPHENVKEHKLARSFLALGPPVSGGGKVLLKNTDTVDMELLLQKITKVQLIFDSMNTLSSKQLSIYSMDSSPQSESANGIGADITSMALDQLRLSLQHTKSFVREAAQEMGLGHLVEASRLPWSSDPGIGEQNNQLQNDVVVVEANVVTCTSRVRHTVLKLYELYKTHFIPKLDDLYELDAKEDRVDLAAGEKLLSFFDKEVEELEVEDQRVCHRVHQRIRLAKMTRVLDMIMRATLRVKVMDENRNDVDMYLGTACIPLVDLLDQQPQDSMYKLLYMPPTNLRGVRRSIDTDNKGRGFVQLRLHLKFSESSFIEEAITVYKTWKDKYILQHETARRRIHQAVIPVQRRRWTTIKGYLDELTKQADTKLHWERTPALLSLVWDIFVLQESSPSHKKNKPMDADEKEYAQSIAKMADKYREIVMKVHKRWVNLQPKLDELMTIQAAALIDAQRTPQLLDDIKHEVEGLDVGLSTAWRQVKQKWQLLLDALEGLVNMQDRKLNLTLAPQLLKSVEKRCSKGLSVRHAEAVSNIQSRWMAITQPNGPLSELRLMEKKGLHWRRTHELLLLLDEQCEGFADVDAKALDTVQNSWEQVQHWLHEIVQMQAQHSIDCEQTPFILEKMHLWRPARIERQSSLNKSEKMYSSSGSAPSSPKYKDEVGNRSRGLFHQSSNSRLSSDASFRSDSGVDDNGQLEGMAEWYAIEEAKYELERIPYHCITTAAEKKNWLAYSRDGKDSRLHITQEDMVFTPANVRIALEERGVIPKTSNFHPLADAKANAGAKDDAWVSPSLLNWKSGSQSIGLPISVKEEIEDLEAAVEKHRDQQDFTLPNPERVAELYEAVQSFGKTDLLWKVDHVVSRNRELAVPENYQLLLREMAMRQISTTEVENLVKSLAFTLQKEVLLAKGITVPLTANPTTLLQLMHRYQVKEVLLPQDTSTIQSLLQERGMDRKGDPVILRGIRIGTRSNATIDSALHGATLKGLNTGLGIIDTQIEILRKSLLFEALRKRNSLIRTFAGESHVLDDENERTEADMFAAAVENAEVDMSGDYLTLVERFQRLLVHESYTKRLAEYAAMDRCMRALLGKSRDEIVTKEEIAMELHSVNKKVIGANYRLPPEAFTEEELIEAANAGRIRTPSAEMLARCPQAKNAPRMAHYAAISYAASVYQEVTSFRSRVDTAINRLQDTFPFDEVSSLDGVSIPKERGRWTLSQSIADWLLGFDASKLSIKRKLSAAHRQRLEWASAAFTLRNRWLQSGLGWCDHRYGEGVGVKILLDRLLLFEAANKMDMVKTEMLLREVRDKCARLRDREREAQAKLEERFQLNLELLEKLVIHAERCTNNRKLHSEETPVLLYKLEQACVVPTGLNERHREAYHTVATHWLPQREHLAELVKMHREGTFSITRTPELLGKMKYHTEGKAGSEELNEDKVAASAQRVAPEFQASFRQRKLNEVRLGQRKEPSSLHLDVNSDDDFTNQSADDVSWKELSHSQRVVQPLSPHEKQTSWKVVNNAVSANAAFAAGASSEKMARIDIQPKLTSALPASPRRKLSLSDELKELLKTPAQWLLSSGPQDESIRPELYFPKEVVLDVTSASLSKPSS
ncbi:unnamed protein product [Phytophthora lilii]|uniref:Unnamed protein product n=1 Tax=Phytophthora lilii TaxID=2077276 RepID=A0A9W6WPV7_9STRA|nr:unnamed protein product [Phytophthora lilii]